MNNGIVLDLKWKKREELKKYFEALKPEYKCLQCGARRTTLEARQFGKTRFARWLCSNCGAVAHVTDLEPEGTKTP